ncbi:MAG TPA: hypothetical protein VF974_07180 [Patescibacteria group bacterium]
MRKSDLEFHTEQRKVGDLIPFEGNPRKMTELQVAFLRQSLQKFGLAEIPVIDTDNVICAGHQRLRVLQLLGEGESVIDVRVPNRKLTPEEFREYNLRSNQNRGDFDYAELANYDLDFLGQIGFDKEELKIKFDLNTAENMPIDPDRMTVMTIMPPEAPKLKEKTTVHFENREDYEKVKQAIESGIINPQRILELL